LFTGHGIWAIACTDGRVIMRSRNPYDEELLEDETPGQYLMRGIPASTSSSAIPSSMPSRLIGDFTINNLNMFAVSWEL